LSETVLLLLDSQLTHKRKEKMMKSPIKTDSIPSPFNSSAQVQAAIESPSGGVEATETATVKAEVPSPLKASEQAALVKQDRATQKQKEQLEKLSGLSSLDWKAIPPPMLAQMLINIPFRGSGTDPDYYLEPWQAMIFAMRCFELELSPFSNEVWFNPKNNKVNVSFEGKLKLARKQGLNLSPPVWERIPEDHSKPLVAYKCTIVAPKGPCTYIATLKEWKMPSSPVWRDRQEHMLQLRAAEKCLSFATGSGVSELMGDQDIQVGEEVRRFIPEPEVVSTEFVEVKPEGK
jgi:hypothetical protein